MPKKVLHKDKIQKVYTVKEALNKVGEQQVYLTHFLRFAQKAKETKDYQVQSDPEFQANAMVGMLQVILELSSFNALLLHHIGLKEEDNLIPEVFMSKIIGAYGELTSNEAMDVIKNGLSDADEKVQKILKHIIEEIKLEEKDEKNEG